MGNICTIERVRGKGRSIGKWKKEGRKKRKKVVDNKKKGAQAEQKR